MIDRLINILQTRTWLHWLLIVLFFFVFSLGMYFPALGKEYLLYGTDTVGHDYVMHLYGWKSILQEGRLPLWNPYIFYGLPFIGTFALCPFYPTQWLYAIFPQNTTFTLQYVLALTVGATCMTIWMRVLGVRLWVAVWAGLALIVSGHFLTLTYAGHLQKMIAIAWAPGAWAACLVLSRRCINASGGYKTPAFMMALCLAMQLLASHAQIFYGTLAVCVLHMGGLSLPLLVKAWTSPEPGIKALIKTTQVVAFSRMVKYLAIAGVLVLLFSSTQMFHSYEISKITNRGNTGLTYEETADTSYPPRELAEYAVAGLWGDSVRDPLTNRAAGTSYSGNWGERIVSDYLGIPILLLVLCLLMKHL